LKRSRERDWKNELCVARRGVIYPSVKIVRGLGKRGKGGNLKKGEYNSSIKGHGGPGRPITKLRKNLEKRKQL